MEGEVGDRVSRPAGPAGGRGFESRPLRQPPQSNRCSWYKTMKCLIAAACLVAPLAVHAQQPAKAPVRPLVTLYDAAGVTKACEAALASPRKAIAVMEAKSGPGPIFDEWNRLQIGLEGPTSDIYLLGEVHPA